MIYFLDYTTKIMDSQLGGMKGMRLILWSISGDLQVVSNCIYCQLISLSLSGFVIVLFKDTRN